MSKILFVALTSIACNYALAQNNLECANKAVEVATTKNFKVHGANTGSCGAKLLTAGKFLETYLVCISDETDASEWVVVMKKNVFKNNKIVQTCGVASAEVQYESQTPNFESQDGILNTVECTMENDDQKAKCK